MINEHSNTNHKNGDDSGTILLPTFDSFLHFDSPEQRQFNNVTIPCILKPPANVNFNSVHDVTMFIITHRSSIDAALRESGVVLFRNFMPLQTPSDFNLFVKSFEGYQDLSYETSMSFAVRQRLEERICTTNEGKSGGLVFHHEQAQTPMWPSKVFFCCQLPAAKGDGGQTGLVSSVLVYDKLKLKYPKFIEQCESRGVQYTFYAGPLQDTSKGAGRSWKSFFHVSTREEAENKMKRGGWTWEWGIGSTGDSMPDDFLKCTTPVLDAVKTVSSGGDTTKKCFFNQLIATVANALEFSNVGMDGGGYNPLIDTPTQEGIDACVRFGPSPNTSDCIDNENTLDLDILLDAKKMCEELAVNVEWQKGDVALVCNYTMMHARRLWHGPVGTRKVLASLVAEPNCTSFGKSLIV